MSFFAFKTLTKRFAYGLKILSKKIIVYLPVDFEASLTHAKSNEIFSAGCEFAKKTWWFFYIDQSVVWVDVHVKTASRVNQFASVVSCFGSGRWAMDFPHKQPGNHIL